VAAVARWCAAQDRIEEMRTSPFCLQIFPEPRRAHIDVGRSV
jgi:hypothetical protein